MTMYSSISDSNIEMSQRVALTNFYMYIFDIDSFFGLTSPPVLLCGHTSERSLCLTVNCSPPPPPPRFLLTAPPPPHSLMTNYLRGCPSLQAPPPPPTLVLE